MDFRRRLHGIDKLIILAVVILTTYGLLGIASATRLNQGEYTEFVKQIIFVVVGFATMLLVAGINFTGIDDSLRNVLALVVYGGIIVLLLLVIFVGSDGGGATRWLAIGPVGIQPSEFAKIGLVFIVATGLDMIGDYINIPLYLLGALAIVGFPILLVFLQPNLSTSVIMFVIFFIQLFTADLDYRYILIAICVAIPLIIGVFFYAKLTVGSDGILKNYQKKRILALVYPEEYSKNESYQTEKSIEAIGSGKLFGKGLFKGILNKSDYVPEPHTDFILAVIGEEWGFVGTFIILCCYLLIAYRGLTLLQDVGDTFTRQLIIGIVSLFLFQTFVNVGVCTGLLPNTGINLPFVSAGGSSYLANCIGIGMLLNIGIRKNSGYRFR